MRWIDRFFGVPDRTVPGRGTMSGLEQEIEGTHRKILRSIEYSIRTEDPDLGVLEHSARVAAVARSIGREMRVSESEAYILHTAAQLHEVGMFTVPLELLERRAPLNPKELERVRAQAEVSARIARAANHPRVVHLIEHQYEDYQRLARGKELSASDLLLAGIFRVADVFVAVTWPRPYQDPVPWDLCTDLFRDGAGTRFHPAAVSFMLKASSEA